VEAAQQPGADAAQLLGHPARLQHRQRGARRRERHELGGERRRDPGARHPGHDTRSPAHGGQGESVGDRLAHHHQIGPDAEALAAPAHRQPADGLDLVGDEHGPGPLGLLAQHGEPGRVGRRSMTGSNTTAASVSPARRTIPRVRSASLNGSSA
jgi:hypothetical protein